MHASSVSTMWSKQQVLCVESGCVLAGSGSGGGEIKGYLLMGMTWGNLSCRLWCPESSRFHHTTSIIQQVQVAPRLLCADAACPICLCMSASVSLPHQHYYHHNIITDTTTPRAGVQSMWGRRRKLACVPMFMNEWTVEQNLPTSCDIRIANGSFQHGWCHQLCTTHAIDSWPDFLSVTSTKPDRLW